MNVICCFKSAECVGRIPLSFIIILYRNVLQRVQLLTYLKGDAKLYFIRRKLIVRTKVSATLVVSY